MDAYCSIVQILAVESRVAFFCHEHAPRVHEVGDFIRYISSNVERFVLDRFAMRI